MRGRYLALIARGGGFGAPADAIAESAARRFGLAPVAAFGRARLYADAAPPRLCGPTAHAALIGEVFARDGTRRRLETLDADLERAIVDSGGGVLLERYWGAYLAFIADRGGGVRVIRDPSGGVGCYRADAFGLACLFSDVDIAVGLGLVGVDIDWRRVAQRLAFPTARDGGACLRGVAAVQPGALLVFDAGADTAASAWSPWAFAAPETALRDPRAAADRLAAEIRACVAAWARLSRRPLLELSGGLDSSIVAACLGEDAPPACVNLYCPAPGGDERDYAAAVARRIGAPLRVVALDGARADLRRVPPVRAPDPDANLLHELIDGAMIEELARAGADAFFSGGGGDNVFCHLSTASPAADALLAGEGPMAALAATRDIAALHGCSLWTALAYGLRKALGAGAARQPRRDAFMTREALAAPPDPHPWVKGPPGARPGKREHVASVAFALWHADAAERSRVAPLRYPLLSQPVVELCLRIPTWMWVAGGRDRAVARNAFAAALPEAIVRRRTKGDLTGFMAETFARHRALVRERLMDGRLAAAGIVDRRAVAAAFDAGDALDPLRRGALLTLAKAEAWADGWLGGATATPPPPGAP